MKEKIGDRYDEERKITILSIFGGIFYLNYFINNLNSTTFRYLRTKDNKIINKKMGNIYKTNPSINLVGICYHYLEINSPNSSAIETVISHQEEIPFNYSFFRDVSGNLKLNINKNNYKFKYYIMLKVIHEIIFDDALLFNEYNAIKNELITRNSNKDKYFKYFDNI